MALIPNLTSKEYDDPQKLREALQRALDDINRDANKPLDIVLGDNVILAWVDDGVTPIPRGYKVADGTNGTFDAKTSKIIQIQKV